MNELKPRHELKHYINYSDYLALKGRLLNVAMLDPHVGEGGTYFIRSLYFDNINDKALQEKLDGVNVREKFRLRFYNHDTSRIVLERKSKVRGLCTKHQTPITRKQCECVLSGNVQCLKQSKDPLLLELYHKMQTQLLRPKTIVDYVREPYVYEQGNVRITFDSNIKTGIYSRNFLNPKVPVIPAGEVGNIILEVKYDEYLPDIMRMILQINDRRATAFSKYAAARMYG